MSLLNEVWPNWNNDSNDITTNILQNNKNLNTFDDISTDNSHNYVPENLYENNYTSKHLYFDGDNSIKLIDLEAENIKLKKMLENTSIQLFDIFNNELFVYILIGYFIIFILDTMVNMN